MKSTLQKSMDEVHLSTVILFQYIPKFNNLLGNTIIERLIQNWTNNNVIFEASKTQVHRIQVFFKKIFCHQWSRYKLMKYNFKKLFLNSWHALKSHLLVTSPNLMCLSDRAMFLGWWTTSTAKENIKPWMNLIWPHENLFIHNKQMNSRGEVPSITDRL